ncbi:hypothetical protein WI36_24120 [Burkholderia ubonensis]|uniref:hypothetical protein n=1 Tax=Burkholderia ubonensis TaxID=101571 RepID=UPI000752F192|nr:hypothetical protein [Burkholderia ubonensis]KUZ66856.1 hypothetical protein WI36_24120 [Burkholderia ubonensis]
MSNRIVSGRATLQIGDERYELIAACFPGIELMREAAERLTAEFSKFSITIQLTATNSRAFDRLFKSAPPPRKRRAEWKQNPLERYAR